MPSLNWQLQLHPHHIVRLTPVEYLQPWRGFFAGITLLERKALLLRLKVGGQGTILRVGCYAAMSQSPPHPHPSHPIVEHIISHPGGSVITIKNTQKCLFWAKKVLKNSHFWPKIAIFGHRHSQQPRMDWRLVEHLISHPGGSVMTI